MKGVFNKYTFDDISNVMVCGDIHGDFETAVFNLCFIRDLNNTLLIIAGDCGFGFEDRIWYKKMYHNLKGYLKERNNRVVFIRGNHDNPAYFDGKSYMHREMMAVPDYSIITVAGHTILCVGGGVSIDRVNRLYLEQKNGLPACRERLGVVRDLFSPRYYWENELPIFDETALDVITAELSVDTVITHSAPSFCEKIDKNGLQDWAKADHTLLEDERIERQVMDKIYDYLIKNQHPLRYWYYGHFHESWFKKIGNVTFQLLDVMQFAPMM